MSDDWIKFSLAVGVCCLLCPPLFGVVLGIGMFCAVWYLLFKVIGG